MTEPTATEVANYARQHGITLTQALRDLRAIVAPTDRQRMESYRAEMNRLQSTLKLVAAQRDTLAAEMLQYPSHYGRETMTVLTDLVESGHITDVHGFLS